jgi:hypothetical protein
MAITTALTFEGVDLTGQEVAKVAIGGRDPPALPNPVDEYTVSELASIAIAEDCPCTPPTRGLC